MLPITNKTESTIRKGGFYKTNFTLEYVYGTFTEVSAGTARANRDFSASFISTTQCAWLQKCYTFSKYP